MGVYRLKKRLSLKRRIAQWSLNLLDLGLDQDLNQGPYERVLRVVMKDVRVVIYKGE